MSDKNFFNKPSPIALSDIAKASGATLVRQENADKIIEDVAPIDVASQTQITFLDNKKYIKYLSSTNAGACILKKEFASKLPSHTIPLISDEPYRVYALVAQMFYPICGDGISDHAHIHETAKIGQGTSIGAGSVIKKGVEIGKNCIIHENVTIGFAKIGDNVIIHPGSQIGQDGFGFAMGVPHIKVPQIGCVIIEDDVEIGSNTCIDRGAGSDTTIGAGTKIDNLVQIAHNVQLGKGCIIVSQVGIAGSTKIGDGVVIGGQTAIAGHIEIASGSIFTARSGVSNSIKEPGTYGGAPAVPVKEWRRSVIMLKQLTKRGLK